MDASGIAKQLVFLTAPGVQVFDMATASGLAREVNDQLSDSPYPFVPEEVKVTDELPISDEDKRKLYQLNAERVFRL
jgi:hypothetical protein